MALINVANETDLTIKLAIAGGRHPSILSDATTGWGTVTSTKTDLTPFGNYVFPTAASLLTISSDNAADGQTGVGARVVVIIGLNEGWNKVVEAIPMNGTVPVTTTNRFLRVNTFAVVHSGDSGTNSGAITVRHGTNPLARILPGTGLAQQAIYSAPVGYRAFVTDYAFSNPSSKIVTFNFQVREGFGNCWQSRFEIPIANQTVTFQPNLPGFMSEKSDLRVKCQTDNGTAQAYFLVLWALEKIT